MIVSLLLILPLRGVLDMVRMVLVSVLDTPHARMFWILFCVDIS